MDAIATQFINSNGPVYLHLCFKSTGSCDVPVAVNAPKHCFVESNVADSNYSRRVRIKWDDEKAQAQIWGIDNDHKAVIPHSPQEFINQLKKHHMFSIEFGCDSSDSYVSQIEISGLQDSMAKLSVNSVPLIPVGPKIRHESLTSAGAAIVAECGDRDSHESWVLAKPDYVQRIASTDQTANPLRIVRSESTRSQQQLPVKNNNEQNPHQRDAGGGFVVLAFS